MALTINLKKIIKHCLTGVISIFAIITTLVVVFYINGILEIENVSYIFLICRLFMYTLIIVFLPWFIKRKQGGVIPEKLKPRLKRTLIILTAVFAVYEILIYLKGF